MDSQEETKMTPERWLGNWPLWMRFLIWTLVYSLFAFVLFACLFSSNDRIGLKYVLTPYSIKLCFLSGTWFAFLIELQAFTVKKFNLPRPPGSEPLPIAFTIILAIGLIACFLIFFGAIGILVYHVVFAQ
jgi:hypothetical protein